MIKILLYPFFPPHFSFKTIRNSSTHTLSRLQEEARNFSAAGGGGGGILKSPESEHPSSEGSPSLDLLLQFQRLLISRIFSSKSAAEGKLVGSGCEEVKGQVKCKDGDSFKVYGETSKSADHFLFCLYHVVIISEYGYVPLQVENCFLNYIWEL